MKTVNVKTTSVLISILLHTEDCVYRAVSKRCLFSLRVKKKTVIAFRKKKVNKDTTIVLEVCGPWMPTRFPKGLGVEGGARGHKQGSLILLMSEPRPSPMLVYREN